MSKATVEYLGFSNTADRREYHLQWRFGLESEDYTVGIALAAFVSGAARYQDGPDICYQKVQRELEAPQEPRQHEFDITIAELAAYRVLHTPAAKRWNAPPSGSNAKPLSGAPATGLPQTR